MRLFEVIESNIQGELETLVPHLKQKHGLKHLWIFDNGNNMIELSAIMVDKEKQKQGAGTGAMNDLVKFADERGLTIVLTPGVKDIHHGTSSRSRLVKFYKRFGFIENKGRKMDFAIGGGKMVRYPNIAEAFQRQPVDHSLPYDDHESDLYIDDLKKRDSNKESWRGPHSGRYLQLFLAGKKPAILLGPGEMGPFQKYVDNGKLTATEIDTFAKTKSTVLTIPGEEWRANQLKKLFTKAIEDDEWFYKYSKLWHSKIGILLGYTNDDIRKFVQDW